MNTHLFYSARRFLPLLVAIGMLWQSVAATRADTFLLTGGGNDTVERFDSTGTNLGPFPTTNLPVPTAIAFDSAGNLYVTNDQSSSRIRKYASNGTDLGVFASTHLVRTYGLIFDGAGNLYAANFGNSTIQKFSPTGVDLGAFISTGISGPVGMAFDGSGNFYVANYSNNTVGKFSAAGANLGVFASTGLATPYALAFDSAGNLYVSNVNSSSYTVRRFSPTGADLGNFIGPGVLSGPTGLVFDSSGNLYVVSQQSRTINKFSPTGAALGVFATTAVGSAPTSLVLLPGGSAPPSVGSVQFGASRYNVNESGGNVFVTVTRVGGSAGAFTVNYTTVNGSALAGTDYMAVSGTLSWADGDTGSRTIQAPILDRGITDGSTKNFFFSLGQPTGGATLGSPASAEVDILENDVIAAPPAIAITSPPANITVDVGAVVPLAARVDDPNGLLSKVQFFLNDQFYGETSAAGPYTLNATAPVAGIYKIEAVAIDTQGRRTSDARSITVAAPSAAGPAPSSAILTDASGRALAAGSTLTLSITAASASDDAPLTRVDVFADGVVFASFDAAGNSLISSAADAGNRPLPRESAEPVANGSVFKAVYTLPGVNKIVSIIAVAINSLGRSQVSQPITVQAVANVADRPPRVNIGGLKNGQKLRVGKPFTVSAAISDPDAAVASSAASDGRRLPVRRAYDATGIIARVEYYLNQLKVKDTVQAPFGFDFTPPAAGAYVVTVIATDAAGLATISEPVQAQAALTPTVSLSVLGGGTMAEGGKKGKVLFSRAGGDDLTDLTVFYQLKGTATNKKDYRGMDNKALAESIIIPAGSDSVKLKIVARDDAAREGTEKLNIALLPSPEDEYDLGAATKAKLLILDND